MLLVVCPNLCLDRVVVVRGFAPGRVQRAESVEELASGKGLNVARAARALGLHVGVVGMVGDGPAAQSILRGARAHSVLLHAIRVVGPVRVCTLIIDPGQPETVINEPGPEVGTREVGRLQRRVRTALKGALAVVLAGSLPPGVPPSLYAEVIRQAPGIPTILDATGEALRLGLAARPFVVKVNQLELQEVAGRSLETLHDVGQAASQLLPSVGGGVLITLGARGALLSTTGGSWHIVPPEVERVNTIGAGDSLTAGLVAGMIRGLPLLEATRLGMAAAAADVTTLLPGKVDPSTVDRLAPEVGVEVL